MTRMFHTNLTPISSSDPNDRSSRPRFWRLRLASSLSRGAPGKSPVSPFAIGLDSWLIALLDFFSAVCPRRRVTS